MRPEHFEDAHVAGRGPHGWLRFKAKVDVVESMGSELYAYFDVEAQARQSDELHELAADAGMEDLPSHGDAPAGRRAPGRREPRRAPASEVELVLDAAQIKLFDPTAAAASPRPQRN